MIKIRDIVEDIIYKNEEALFALSQEFINLSAYAKQIQKEVERRTMKDVKISGIVVALSRIQKELDKKHPLIQNIAIENITAKSPLSEIVFPKIPKILSQLSSLYEKISTKNDDFFTMTLSTSDITVICSDRLKPLVLGHFSEKPIVEKNGLASLGISLDPKYYPRPNITYSLIRRIARKRIPLAETITTYTEIIFIFDDEYLSDVLRLFKVNHDL